MKNYLCALAVAGCMAASCGSESNFDVDVSNIKADVRLERFDLVMDSVAPDSIYNALPRLKAEYGDFLNLYLEGIAGLGSPETQQFQTNYEDFCSYCKLNSVYSDVEKVFPASVPMEPIFEDGFRHYRYYFPNDSLPKIYTIISGFQESVFPSEGLVAFSLDKYLGSSYPTYAQLGIENYKRIRMCKEMMAADYFRTIAATRYPKSEDCEDNLLNEMIYRGREVYFLKSMLPSAPDSLLWGYSDYQLRWAETYESNVWTYLIDRKLLFDHNPRLIQSLTGEGPFTNAFGNQSAPGVAAYCGYGIVCGYMRRNPDVSLAKLMETKDMNTIYSKSKYNP